MIKYSTEKPPNWDTILQHFSGIDWNRGIIVTYGDTYYSKYPISNDLIAHEETHMRQQEANGGPEKWWERYYIDPLFRLTQEVEAYRNQIKYIKDHTEEMTRDQRRDRIKHMATALSSSIYGSIIPFDKAMRILKS